MKTNYVNPKELYDPRFFTHAVVADGNARAVYLSGQVSYDRDGFVIGKDDLRAQCEQVFKSLTHALRAAGATWGDVVKMTGYMVGMSPDAVNVYREARSRHLDPKRMPASTLVGVSRLVHEHLLIEVDLVALVGRRPGKAAKKPAKKRRKSKSR